MKRKPCGCLILGRKEHIMISEEQMRSVGIGAVLPDLDGEMMESAMKGLRETADFGDATCILAFGGWWTLALALSIRLAIDRIVLIHPCGKTEFDKTQEKQIRRWEGFVRRNLFFCVSDILIIEPEEKECGGIRPPDWSRLCNAELKRLGLDEKSWTNCEFFCQKAILSFLTGGDFGNLLAK